MEHGYIAPNAIVSLCGNVVDRTPNKPESTPLTATAAGTAVCGECLTVWRDLRQAVSA